MPIVDADSQFYRAVPPGTAPDYDSDNPILRVIGLVETLEPAADREHYLADSVQHLLPFSELGLYGPSGGDWQIADPRQQDNKNDFQKQNVNSFRAADFTISRGYATAGDWTGTFVRFAYSASPLSELGRVSDGNPGASLRLYTQIGDTGSDGLILVPYQPRTRRFEVELWSFGGGAGVLRPLLGPRGQAALDAGLIQLRPDLVRGDAAAFTGPAFDGDREAAVRSGNALGLFNRAADHTMHPVRPLRIETAWANESATAWDSRQGQNHVHTFSMVLRGWNHYMQVGQSRNPHGGVGFLEFRNLMSNYFGIEGDRRAALGQEWLPELGRDLEPYNFDAGTWRPAEAFAVGAKAGTTKRETFMTVDYMDLHILQPDCGIGIHRHRDNQEVFFLIDGKGLMIVGDWAERPERQRAFEVRTMVPGDLSLCKTGQLHALFNALDEPASLFMFGGYD
jgi:mannose-6-phosphate isomerase-like protein (cupin superfamily)